MRAVAQQALHRRHIAVVIFGCALITVAILSPRSAGAFEEPTKDDPLPGLVPAPANLPGAVRWQLAQRLPVGYLWAAAWSPDGKQVALAESRYVRICDTQTLAPVRFLVGHANRVTSVVYSQDGSKIATSSFDGTVRVWEVNGAPLLVLKGHDAPVRDVCWSPDGKQLASAGDDGTVRIWNADGSTAVTFKEHEAPVNCVNWSRDGERLASGDVNRMVRIWGRDGKSIAACEGHHGKVRSVAWSPNGQTVASADLGFKDPVSNNYSASIRFWTREGKELKSLERGEPVQSLAYSPNGEWLAAGNEGGSASLMMKDGTAVSTLRNSGIAVAWSPDSRKVVATGRGRAIISGVDGSDGASLIRGDTRRYLIVDWSPDGQLLAAHSLGGTLSLWKENGQPGPEFKQPIAGTVGMAWDADSKRFLTSTNDELRFGNIDGTQGKPLEGVVRRSDRIAWSRDGQRIACADSYNSSSSPIQLRDANGKVLKTLAGHDGGTTMLAWSPDNKLLASSGRDGTLRLWTSDGEPGPVMEGLTRDVDSVGWTADSRRIVAGYDSGDYQYWNNDGTPGPEVPAHDESIMFNALSPDGKRLATGSWDESIKLWDPEGKELRTLSGHAGPLYWLSWHKDNRRLASGSYDATARVWDTDTGEQLLIIFSLNPETAVALTRTGEIHGGTPELLDSEFLFLIEQPNGSMEIQTYAQFKQRAETGK